MDRTRLPPTVGVAAALVVLGVLAIPFLVVDTAAAATYYGGGDVNGLGVGLFALIAIVVFAAGREERSDPQLVAGATLALGTFAVVLAVLWSVSVPTGLITQLSTLTVLVYHRALLVAATAAMPVSAAWYARTLGIF